MTKLGDLKNARWSIPRGWDIRETHAGDIAVGYLSADDVVRAYIPSNRQRLLVPRTAALILAGSMASSEQDWHWSLAEIDGRWVATATHLNFKVAQVVTGARWGGGTTVQIVVAPPWSLSQHIAVLEGLAWTRDEAKQREARERGDATGGSSRR